MSLERAVAAPFRAEGRRRMPKGDFIVDLTINREWYTPDQAKRLVDVATGEGLLTVEEGDLALAFDPESTEIPEDFRPDESVLRERDTFERVLDALVGAGLDKQSAVAAINGLQSDLGVTVEAAAVLYAHREGLDVADHAERALEELGS